MRTVSSQIEIGTSPEKLLMAFTDSGMLKRWWGVERSFIELKPGGIYTLAWGISENGIRYVSTGVICNYEPGLLLHIGDYMYLSPERPFMGPLGLKLETAPLQGGALLKLEQGPYPDGMGTDWDWYYEVVNDAWPKVLQTLKQYLEHDI